MEREKAPLHSSPPQGTSRQPRRRLRVSIRSVKQPWVHLHAQEVEWKETWEGAELGTNCLNSMCVLGLENKCVWGNGSITLYWQTTSNRINIWKQRNGVQPSEDTLESSLSHSSVYGYPLNGWDLLKLLFRPSSPFPKSDSFYETGSWAATYRKNQEMNVCIPYAQNVFKWQGLEGRFLKGKIAISR